MTDDDITDAEIDAAWSVLTKEMDVAYAARVNDFVDEHGEVRKEALRAADEEAERMNRDLMRRALAAAWAARRS